MKKTLTLTLAATMIVGSIQARTWTSSDGGKSFKGDYVSQTDEFVTVTRGFKKIRFKISMLSEVDRKWLEEKKSEPNKRSGDTDHGTLGEKFKGNMVKLVDNQYAAYQAESGADYYIIYFTASW